MRLQQEFLIEHVYPLLGFDVKTRITFIQVIQLRDHFLNLNSDCRIVGLEQYNGSVIIVTEVWESYGDIYNSSWVELAAYKFNPDARVSVYVKLQDSVLKNK